MSVSDKKGKRRPFDPLAEKITFGGNDKGDVKTIDITDRELQEGILLQLKLISGQYIIEFQGNKFITRRIIASFLSWLDNKIYIIWLY